MMEKRVLVRVKEFYEKLRCNDYKIYSILLFPYVVMLIVVAKDEYEALNMYKSKQFLLIGFPNDVDIIITDKISNNIFDVSMDFNTYSVDDIRNCEIDKNSDDFREIKEILEEFIKQYNEGKIRIVHNNEISNTNICTGFV